MIRRATQITKQVSRITRIPSQEACRPSRKVCNQIRKARRLSRQFGTGGQRLNICETLVGKLHYIIKHRLWI